MDAEHIFQYMLGFLTLLGAPIAYVWKKVNHNEIAVAKVITKIESMEKSQNHIERQLDEIHSHIMGKNK